MQGFGRETAEIFAVEVEGRRRSARWQRCSNLAGRHGACEVQRRRASTVQLRRGWVTTGLELSDASEATVTLGDDRG